MSFETGLAGLAAGSEGFSGLYGFPVLSWACEPDRLFTGTHESIARALHDKYVTEQVALGATERTNPALVPWERLSEEFRESNRRQADQVVARLTAAGCDIAPLSDWEAERFVFTGDEIDEMARLEHERWRNERRAAGWTYAPGVKDLQRKTNPLLVAWDDLPGDVREENRAIVRELPRALADVGLQVVRISPPAAAATRHDRAPA